LVQYTRKEIELRGDRSADDMLRSLEGLVKDREKQKDPLNNKSSRNMNSNNDNLQKHKQVESRTKDDENKNQSQKQNNSSGMHRKEYDKDPNGSSLSTSMEQKQEIIKANNLESNEWWKVEDTIEGEEGEGMVAVSVMKGAAENVAMQSLRKQGSFHVPMLHGTPSGQDGELELELQVEQVEELEGINKKNKNEGLVIKTNLGGYVADGDGPPTTRVMTAKSPVSALSGDLITEPPLHHPSTGSGREESNLNESPLSTNSSVNSNTTSSLNSASEKAARLTKAAAVARAHYLRTAVDPVFVPLLDAVVFHKPR